MTDEERAERVGRCEHGTIRGEGCWLCENAELNRVRAELDRVMAERDEWRHRLGLSIVYQDERDAALAKAKTAEAERDAAEADYNKAHSEGWADHEDLVSTASGLAHRVGEVLVERDAAIARAEKAEAQVREDTGRLDDWSARLVRAEEQTNKYERNWYDARAERDAALAQVKQLREFWADLEARSADAHAVYQAEAHRRGDVRHPDAYADLSEATKEWDRVLVRWVQSTLPAPEPKP